MTRIRFAHLLVCLATLVVANAQTGTPVPELASLDQAVLKILDTYKIPGASLAIAKDGRLVYSRGFGLADLTSREPVQPDTLFRIASVSKPITAIGVLKLVEEGKLTLDTRVLALLNRTATADPRYQDITVRHLLEHSGGLDLELWGFDPSFPDRASLLALGVKMPPTRADVLDFVLANLPLAYTPGTRSTYSNIGFMFLTEVIEKASGQKYETYMKEKILAPLGIVRMRVAGSLLTERQPGEARYWDNNSKDAPIFDGLPAEVEAPYGTFHLRIFESGGGWLATAPDLVRLLTAFDGATLPSPLRPATIQLMTARPAFTPNADSSWYGLGWTFTQSPQGLRWDHDGAIPGTSAWMVRGRNGVSLAILANHLPEDELRFLTEIEALLGQGLTSITRWPTTDLFPSYFPGNAPRLADAGVVHAATLRPGALASGSVVKLFGTNLAGGQVRANGAVLETLWESDGELQVRLPSSALGPTRLEVFRQGQLSNAITLEVNSSAPGLFTVSRNGYGLAAALNQDATPNSLTRPAAAGSIVVLWATGGPITEVLVNDTPATILFNGPAPGLVPGITQLNVRLPLALPSGRLSVQLRNGPALSPAEVELFVRSQ